MLEIVIAGRHDEQGGEDFFDRLCAAGDHNHQLLTAAGIEHRFTLVEWNPARNRTLLADMLVERLPWWHGTLVVDGEWHQALSTNPDLEFMPFLARNAAIRRSSADVVLTMNADVWLSEELVQNLATQTLQDGVVYRAVGVNDLEPPHDSKSDFLMLTRIGWAVLGGFNERVRFAESHKDVQFCVNAEVSGYTFESLGTIYRTGQKQAPASPQESAWDYQTSYSNPKSWGLSAGIDEPAGNGRVLVHHPLTHGALLSIIVPAACPQHQESAPGTLPTLPVENLAPLVNTALAAAKGQFVVVTADRTLQAFGGSEELITMLRNTTAGLIAPAGSVVRHPQLGTVPTPGAPYVMRRDLIDIFSDWDEREPDAAMAFWLRASERAEIATIGPDPAQPLLPVSISAGMQAETLTRRGEWIPRGVFDGVIREHLAAARKVHTVLRDWLDAAAPDMDALCAIVGPDWATSSLLELVHTQNRMLAGVFTTVAEEEGSWRWGYRLRPLKELPYAGATYILAGAGAQLTDRLASIGCTGTVHVVCPSDDPELTAPDAELDSLRRAQTRDLAENQISAIQSRLPLLSQLDPARAWAHRYDAAQACERAKLPAVALELYREVTAECTTDMALSMRAAFHTARLLIERGALQQAAPLLSKILKNNPGHRAARRLFDQITKQELSA